MNTGSSTEGSFFEGLVRQRLIIPVGAAGAFARGARFEDVLLRVDGLLCALSASDNPEIYTFPPVIDREVLEKVHYFDSFPHLCGSVYSFFGDEHQAGELAARVRNGAPWQEMLAMTGVALNPAACYPLYPVLTGILPAAGRRVTMLNWVFRHEPSPEPTRMLSFRVREFVSLGSSSEVLAWRDRWLRQALDFLHSLGLAAVSETANDPFFGSAGRNLASDQRASRLKIEIQCPINPGAPPTALCSFNFHQAFFGVTFDIRTHSGQLANTACVGFGLERVVMALFSAHGFDVASWPSAVRTQLWPPSVDLPRS